MRFYRSERASPSILPANPSVFAKIARVCNRVKMVLTGFGFLMRLTFAIELLHCERCKQGDCPLKPLKAFAPRRKCEVIH